MTRNSRSARVATTEHLADLLDRAREDGDESSYAALSAGSATLEAITIAGRRVVRAAAAPIAAGLVFLTALVANAAQADSAPVLVCKRAGAPVITTDRNGRTVIRVHKVCELNPRPVAPTR